MADTPKPCKNDCGFHHCHGDSMLEECLLALLRQPLPSPLLDLPVQSFEDPLGDPKMEPLPFRVSSSDQSETDPEQNMTFKDEPIVVASFYHDQCDDVSLTSSSGWSRTNMAERIPRFRPYQDKKWKSSFQRLINFKNEFGHCCVPHSYSADAALARWVKRQRHQYNKFIGNNGSSTLTTSRLEQLESVGFVFHSHAAAWFERIDELKDFQQSSGHCNVPSTYPENPALATWVKSQRRQYKLRVSGLQSTMTMDRFGVLHSMGFLFEPRLAAFENAQLEMKTRKKNVKSFGPSRKVLRPL